MKRQIIFRGKCEVTNNWIYGGISLFGNECTIFDENDFTNSAYDVVRHTVGQYIGLKDKKGVEIYEGDILEDSFNGNRIKIIYLANSFVGKYISEKYYGGNIDNRNYLQWEVIGNVHDNLELL